MVETQICKLRTSDTFVGRVYSIFILTVYYYFYKIKKRQLRSKISSKLIFASCVGYFDRAYYGFYVTSRMLVVIEEDKI